MQRERRERTGTSGFLWQDPMTDLERAWYEGWRLMRRTCDLTPGQAQLIDDIQRMRGCSRVKQALEIVQQTSHCPADSLGLSEKLRHYFLTGAVLDLTVPEAYDQETDANYRGNVAQHRHAFSPSIGTRESLAEAMNGQEVASRILKETVIKDRPALIRAGR